MLRLLLKDVKHVDLALEPDRVDASVGITIVVDHNLEDASSAEPSKRFCVGMSFPDLRLVERKSDLRPDGTREGFQIALTRQKQATGFRACGATLLSHWNSLSIRFISPQVHPRGRVYGIVLPGRIARESDE